MTSDDKVRIQFSVLKGDLEELIQRLDKEDFQLWQPIYAEEVQKQITRFQSLLEKRVFRKHHNAFAEAMQGMVMAHVSLAVREIMEAKRIVAPMQAREKAKAKGDQSRELTRRIAQEHRRPDGGPLTHGQLLNPVQAERARQGMKPLGTPREGGEENDESALKAIGRHLKDFSY